MDIAQVRRLFTAVGMLTITLDAQPKITRNDVEKQQQQFIKDRWRLISDAAALQLRAQQEIQRQENALMNYVVQHIKDSINRAIDETSPAAQVQRLFEDKELLQAFHQAIHGDPTTWFETVAKRAADIMVDKLSDHAPEWADPAIIKEILRTGSTLLSMNAEANQINNRGQTLLTRATAIDRMRRSLLDQSRTRDNTNPENKQQTTNDVAALDQAVTQLDPWLSRGDRLFDNADGMHDQAAEDRFYTAFPELAMCAKCRQSAITNSPLTEVQQAFPSGALEIHFDPSSMSPSEHEAWQKNQDKVARETKSDARKPAAKLTCPPELAGQIADAEDRLATFCPLGPGDHSEYEVAASRSCTQDYQKTLAALRKSCK